MDIASRIQEVIRKNQLNAAKFADRIGVQRSNLSHVLTGRNKPGLDFIEKVLTEFPNIDANWLITGQNSSFDAPTAPIKDAESKMRPVANQTEELEAKVNLNHPKPIASNEKEVKVEKIIVLYTNGTFDEYKK